MSNTGNYNTGKYNTGSYNTGGFNTGSCNIGGFNTGSYNIGSCNTGSCNTGDFNTGSCNTGDFNTGDWNTVNREAGFFNTTQNKTIRVFNKDCALKDWENAKKPSCLYFKRTDWVYKENMTEEEKQENPNYQTTGGYLKEFGYKEAFTLSMQKASDEEIELLKALPNFDADIFYEISGYDIRTREIPMTTQQTTNY